MTLDRALSGAVVQIDAVDRLLLDVGERLEYLPFSVWSTGRRRRPKTSRPTQQGQLAVHLDEGRLR
jgi:hypothetical protein